MGASSSQAKEEDLKTLQAQCESFKIAPHVNLVFTRGSKREASYHFQCTFCWASFSDQQLYACHSYFGKAISPSFGELVRLVAFRSAGDSKARGAWLTSCLLVEIISQNDRFKAVVICCICIFQTPCWLWDVCSFCFWWRFYKVLAGEYSQCSCHIVIRSLCLQPFLCYVVPTALTWPSTLRMMDWVDADVAMVE